MDLLTVSCRIFYLIGIPDEYVPMKDIPCYFMRGINWYMCLTYFYKSPIWTKSKIPTAIVGVYIVVVVI